MGTRFKVIMRNGDEKIIIEDVRYPLKPGQEVLVGDRNSKGIVLEEVSDEN